MWVQVTMGWKYRSGGLAILGIHCVLERIYTDNGMSGPVKGYLDLYLSGWFKGIFAHGWLDCDSERESLWKWRILRRRNIIPVAPPASRYLPYEMTPGRDLPYFFGFIPGTLPWSHGCFNKSEFMSDL